MRALRFRHRLGAALHDELVRELVFTAAHAAPHHEHREDLRLAEEDAVDNVRLLRKREPVRVLVDVAFPGIS